MKTLLLGDVAQQYSIVDMQDQLAAEAREKRRTDASQDGRLGALEAENRDLKLRLAVLIRLLVSKGVLSAEEISTMILQMDEACSASGREFAGAGKP